MKQAIFPMEESIMSQQQFDLLAAIADKADISLFDIEAMDRSHGQWHLKITGWGWVSTSELLKAKGAQH